MATRSKSKTKNTPRTRTKKATPVKTIVVKPVDELVGQTGLFRIKATGRAGRVVYDEVHGGGKNAFTRKDGSGFYLSRADKDDTKWRWVEPGTKIEVLPAPVGQQVWLPGDSWITARGRELDASGATVEIVARHGNVLTAWVKEEAVMRQSDGEAKRGDWGELDSHVAKLIIGGDFDREPGETGKPFLVR